MKKALLLLVLSLSVLLACRRLIVGLPTATILHQPPTSTRSFNPAPSTRLPIVTPAKVTVATPGKNYGRIALRHIEMLAETIGARKAGTPNEVEAAQYINTALQELGYTPQLQPFSFNTEESDEGASLNSANVIAVKPGLSESEIIVGAHYDSDDAGGGADDNASGVGVMLEVAEMIRAIQTQYTIRFIAFGAEEVDLNGSRFFVDQMRESEIQNSIVMINLDSLIAGDIVYVYGAARPKGIIRDWILERALSNGFEMETRAGDDLDLPDGTPCDCSDYAPFKDVGIPFIYFEATNWNLGKKDGYTQVDPRYGERGEIWHTKYDNLDYIEQTFPGRVKDHLNVFVTLLFDLLTQFKK